MNRRDIEYVRYDGINIECRSPQRIESFKIPNLTNADRMFELTSSLIEANLGSTTKLESAKEMFRGSSVKKIKMNHLDSLKIGRGMFEHCTELLSVPFINAPRLIDAGWMFKKCSSLTTVILLKIRNLYNATLMFFGCVNLRTVILGPTPHLVSCDMMFQDCVNLRRVILMHIPNICSATMMFKNCKNLRYLTINSTFHYLNGVSDMFLGCISLPTDIIQRINDSLAPPEVIRCLHLVNNSEITETDDEEELNVISVMCT